jgi:uncharacterized protein (UPF0276 family)
MDISRIPQYGVGIQFNPHVVSWLDLDVLPVDLIEVLVDSLAGALDSPYVLRPGAAEEIEVLRRRAPVIAHSNYGGDFGFGPLEQTSALGRHVAIAQTMGTPWIANHCFYGDRSIAEMWSCPLQFSAREVDRVAARARHIQKAYGVPLLHENAAYYFAPPGSDLDEAEFMRRLVTTADTFLHLDLHNLYTNSRNLPGYSCDDFLAGIPLDRVVAIHLAGGSEAGGFYHDWHDDRIPEPVWSMLESVLARTRVRAVILEYQGRAHHPDTRVLGSSADLEMVRNDLARAHGLWRTAYGASARGTPAAHHEIADGR